MTDGRADDTIHNMQLLTEAAIKQIAKSCPHILNAWPDDELEFSVTWRVRRKA